MRWLCSALTCRPGQADANADICRLCRCADSRGDGQNPGHDRARPVPDQDRRPRGAGREVHVRPEGGVATLDSLRRGLRAGNDVGAVMKRVSLCIAGIVGIEDYGLPPLQCQTREMALVNVVLQGLHGEMALPFPRPTACYISNQHYASHIMTNTVYMPIGESRSIQHFAHLYHELGHYLWHALDDPRLAPLREGYGRATATIDAHYAGLARDGMAGEMGPAYATNCAEWARAQWTEWFTEAFCDLFGVFAGGACQRVGVSAHGGQEALACVRARGVCAAVSPAQRRKNGNDVYRAKAGRIRQGRGCDTG